MRITGVVQGVGFRPFVYRLARQLGLAGWVSNSAQGVLIEIEGDEDAVHAFVDRLGREKPAPAHIQQISQMEIPLVGEPAFEIRQSDGDGPKTTLVLPDLAICADCLAEIFDPTNRRYHYPFTNCTNCGPRYSIIEGLPYDRPQTTMRGFSMCPACRAEYDDPADRRFHAQPNACPICGPQMAFWNGNGILLAEQGDAIHAAAQAIRQGWVVAVKGIGGFHLCVDARSYEAVAQLRQRKGRPAKPFALMFPDLAAVERACQLSAQERQLLTSTAAPIVLLDRRADSGLAENIAPSNPTLGAMLPYTPLHHLLMAELGFPIVATSGNLSDEPICIDEAEALTRLHGIADFFLVHNRPIVRSVDDSVVRVLAGEVQILRRSRGYAPLPVPIADAGKESVLAVGAHLKNTVALAVGGNLFASQHIGDLETPQSYESFRQTIDSLCRLYEAQPATVVCDAHPDYLSSQYAAQLAASWGAQLVKVQHHYAHILSGMAEHGLQPPVLGLAWDGTGYGEDGTIWGGEFLRITAEGFQRVAHLRPFPLTGGDMAVRQPRRSALGMLYAHLGPTIFESDSLPLPYFSAEEGRILAAMLKKGINTIPTSSMGRLFDGVAALLGLHPTVDFEGQAAMALEFAAADVGEAAYAINVKFSPAAPLVLDWGPMVDQLMADCQHGLSLGEMAGKFHNALVDVALLVARHIGLESVVLSGGCFQNKLLTEKLIAHLRADGFHPYWQGQIPTNDGGIAVGQAAAVMSK
ncbi:MAG: carbamoyltransferase HypF [Caldilineaceae bacterium]|nr:carbamoyltransferase HypF [Caldilineaceae bacterium]